MHICQSRRGGEARVALVTFLRADEQLTPHLVEVAARLRAENLIGTVLVACDVQGLPGLPPWVRTVAVPGATKHVRLREALALLEEEWVLGIDHDVTVFPARLSAFLRTVGPCGADLAWGRIDCGEARGWLGRLISIDKRLSHGCLRPLLWRLGLGASVPGQVLAMRRVPFLAPTAAADTALDDLSLGLEVNTRGLRVHASSVVLGEERPPASLAQLFAQRARWAGGYAALLGAHRRSPRALALLLVHAGAYHAAWVPAWLAIAVAARVSPWCGVAALLGLLWVLTETVSRIGDALAYALLMPIAHVYWAWNVLRCLAGRGGV